MRWDLDRTAGRRPGRRRLAAAAVLALLLTVALSGCGLFSAGVTITAPAEMNVTSGDFHSGGSLPVRFTCAGGRPLTPALSWTGTPAGTKSFALVVDDSNAPITPYVYWVVFDIGPGTSALLEGQLPPGALQARGTAGYAQYDPPCPGNRPHGYRFTVYALDKVLNLPNGASLQAAWQTIAAATIGRGRLAVNVAMRSA